MSPAGAAMDTTRGAEYTTPFTMALMTRRRSWLGGDMFQSGHDWGPGSSGWVTKDGLAWYAPTGY
jgi:hypothetical protein